MTLRYPRPRVLEEICKAGEKPPRHAVIEASAGTGKTYTLEHSVVELLLAGVPAEKLLVVTFTERATYELRERVRTLLRRIVGGELPDGAAGAERFWEIDATGRATLERALLAFDEAPIYTIHGFCHRVLTENAFVAGRVFEQELVDAKSAFSSGFMHVLRHELAEDPHRSVDLRAWLREHTVEELEELLQEIDAKRAGVRPFLDKGGLQADLAELKRNVEGPSFARLKEAVSTAAIHAGTRTALLERLGELPAIVQDPEVTGSLVGLHVSRMRSRITSFVFGEPKRAAAIRSIRGIGGFLSRLSAIEEKLVTIEAAVAQVFLPSIQARIALEKAANGRFDFSDMLSIVRDAITKGPQRELLLERVRERYRHALIDEFQDTDEVQWAIFEEVFARSPGGHGLWVIGDPKQSIYGWRGADVFAYLRARDVLLAGAKPVPLDENFRSTAPLIEAYNRIFDQHAAKPFFPKRIRYGAPVRCGRRKLVAVDARGKPVAPIHIFDLDAASMTADGLRTALAGRIAREIESLLADGLWLGEGPDAKRIEASDIFILTRTAREGELAARFLAGRRVPFAFYKQDGLFQTDEARDIHRVLAAIDEPRDRSKRARAWLTPFFGLELEDIAKGDPDAAILKRLYSWERLAGRGDFRGLFASLVEETGLLRREILLSASERRLTNYLHILEVLLETVGRQRLGLRELAQLLRSWIREERSPGGDGNVQRLESDAKAVQIMTLHKAKGLEAAVVFLFGGYTDPKGRELHVYHDRDGAKEDKTDEQKRREKLGTVFFHDETGKRLVHVGALTPEVRSLVLEERDEENRRLLYVGITRAKARLYLTGFDKVAKEGKGLVWNYGYLNGTYLPLAERLHALIHEQEPPPGFEVEKLPVSDDRGAAAVVAHGPAAASWTPPPELLAASEARTIEEDCKTLRKGGAPLLLTSYSRMKKGFTPSAAEIEADTLQEEPPAEGTELAVALEEEIPPGGANTGQFFHDVLERLPFESVGESPSFDAWRDRVDVKPLFERCLSRRGIAGRYLLGSQRIVHRTLTKRLDLGGTVLEAGLGACTRNLRELEFAYPIPEDAHLELPAGSPFSVERGWIRGFIDFIFEHEGRTYLLDWKTDTLDAYDAKSVEDHVRASYWIQVQVYTLALARMLALAGHEDHERRFGGVLYCFLRGMRPEEDAGLGVYFLRPDREAVASFERELVAFEYR